VAATAPEDVPYTPAGQSVQEPASARLYWPGPHRTDVLFVEPAGQEYPALQGPVHVLTEEPPVPKRPASHGPGATNHIHTNEHARMHTKNDPYVGWGGGGSPNFPHTQHPHTHTHTHKHPPEHELLDSPAILPKRPGSQAEHVTAPTPLHCPAGHWVTAEVVDPAGQVNPALQSPEHSAEVRPVVEPNLPAHTWHVQRGHERPVDGGGGIAAHGQPPGKAPGDRPSHTARARTFGTNTTSTHPLDN
jgi:hypothetical protein